MSPTSWLSAALVLVAAAAPAAAQTPPPNPLARPPAWAGAFADAEARLELRPGGEGFVGALSIAGRDLLAGGRVVAPTRLEGWFEVDGHRFAITATLDGPDALTLVSDGHTRRLTRSAAGAARVVDDGPATRWLHPAGWVAFDLPAGWTLQRVDAEVVLATCGDDGALLVTGGALEAEDRGRATADLLREAGPGVLADLGVRPAGGPADDGPLEGRGLAGHALVWEGARGERPVRVWVAGLRAPAHYALVVLVADAARLDAHRAAARRVAASLTLTPPAAPARQAVALAGRRFAHVETTPAGSFFAWFEFPDERRVKKTLSGMGGVSESWGTYAVDGEVVRLRFDDGEDALEVVRGDDGRVTALRRPGGRVYRAR